VNVIAVYGSGGFEFGERGVTGKRSQMTGWISNFYVRQPRGLPPELATGEERKLAPAETAAGLT